MGDTRKPAAKVKDYRLYELERIAADALKLLFVRYKPAPHQKISQRTCDSLQVEVKNPRTLGRQISIKDISSVTAEPTRGWDEAAATTKIVFA